MDKLKQGKYSQEFLKLYRDAIYNAANGSNAPLEAFKSAYPEDYKLFSTMYRKRVAMRESLEVLKMFNEPVYWFTLTFNNCKDKNSIKYKRNEACEFLKNIAPIYLMVEEYGAENERYHIHGFLIFRYGCGFEDFKKWHSRQNLKLLEDLDNNAKGKIHYLTNYCSKCVPRIRRSKALSGAYNFYKNKSGLRRNFPSLFSSQFQEQVVNYVSLF